MIGSDYNDFCEELNGGEPIGSTLLPHFLSISKALVEQEREWMILRSTDTSVTISAGGTWQTGISLSGVARMNSFYGERPIKLFDGSNRVHGYRQVPFEERLKYREDSNTFVYDELNKTLYLNGTVPFAGTLYISHTKYSPEIEDNTSWVFPDWAHPLLGLFAVGVYKGGVDFDEINARMSADNKALAQALMGRLVVWDARKQEQELLEYDPYDNENDFRNGAINIHK